MLTFSSKEALDIKGVRSQDQGYSLLISFYDYYDSLPQG